MGLGCFPILFFCFSVQCDIKERAWNLRAVDLGSNPCSITLKFCATVGELLNVSVPRFLHG